jgi:hypothetical protein
MAELTVGDLPAVTRARFVDDDAAQAALGAVLVAARRYCRWHVSPARTAEEVTLDGGGGRVLTLPTRRMTALSSVSENGTELDLDVLEWSETGSVRKCSGRSWSCRYRSIEATFDHGYTEDEAADWRKAIVDMVNEVSILMSNTSGDTAGPLKRKHVDDVEYEWSDQLSAAAERAVYSVTYVLDSYQIFPVLFA